VGAEQVSGADVEAGGGQGSVKPASSVPGPMAEQPPTPWLKPCLAPALRAEGSTGSMGSHSPAHTSFQLLTLQGLGTRTATTVP